MLLPKKLRTLIVLIVAVMLVQLGGRVLITGEFQTPTGMVSTRSLPPMRAEGTSARLLGLAFIGIAVMGAVASLRTRKTSSTEEQSDDLS